MLLRALRIVGGLTVVWCQSFHMYSRVALRLCYSTEGDL